VDRSAPKAVRAPASVAMLAKGRPFKPSSRWGFACPLALQL
jgi:hypothetical protein